MNKTQTQLLEKEIEIKNLKITINNLTDQIKDIEAKLKQKSEELYQQNIIKYSIINDFINNLEKELKDIDEENLKQNKNDIDLLNNTINQVENKVNKVDYNIGNLVYFNIRIIADFYIGNTQINLCSHNYYENDKLDNSRIKLIAHDEACIWDFQQNGNSFQFTMNSKEEVRGCKIQMFNNNIICTNTQLGSNFSFESGVIYKYYKIKSIDTGEYLYVDIDKKRDHLSYYISLTKKKGLATDFMIKINQ